ncbi:MAG: type II/IV secretion system protein [Dehalococcoidia bacterium]|nr:type II/IV secretion system protein [Dehalococcoidia bacterium]
MAERKLMQPGGRKQIDQLLVEGAFITPEQLEAARETSRQSRKDLRQVLLEQRLISQETLATVLSFQLNVPTVDLKQTQVQPAALALVSEQMAREYNVLPLSLDGDTLTVAMEDPDDLQLIDTLAVLTKKRIKPVIPLRSGIRDAINTHYKLTTEIEKELKQMLGTAQARALTDPLLTIDAIGQAPIVRAVDLLLAQAVKERASDIHIVPDERGLQIRYRIDGVLHDTVSLPEEVHPAIVTRIKVMANMNIAERRRAQDGQFSATVADREIDFRVATVGTSYGEMVVLRVLDKSFNLFQLLELGISPNIREIYERCISSPFGMVLISGPTGSGKTTTLYASVSQLNAEELNIMTVEDPIEYQFQGIRQIQVNRAADVTFATGLRAIMRLDPDVILVGEIRDAETAQTAITAALTGHLVLTSIHANDAVGALVRLVDLGVEPFLVTSAVVAAASQRLVRKVCPYCQELREASPPEIAAYQKEMGEEKREFYYGTGCNFCSFTGFLGRIGVFEVLPVSDQIRSLVSRQASAPEIKAQALKDGMITMRCDGMMKAKEGKTTPGEVARHVFTIG